MKTASLEILEKAELPPAQAHAILKVMESEMASAHEPLATKGDVLAVRADLLADMQTVKADMRALRAELLAAMADLRADMAATYGGMEGRLSRWVLTCILAQTAVMAGFGYFLVAHWKS
jgi:hypothetical protein